MKHRVLEYTAVFQEEKVGGYSVWVPSLPGCASQGETFEEALKNIKEAIELYLESAKKYKLEDEDFKKQFVLPVKVYALAASSVRPRSCKSIQENGIWICYPARYSYENATS